jgi:predicted DsbA family dithiol-disulfide isomerase
MEPIRISYFSDILCVWAYIAQIRLDELIANFPDQVSIDYHFFSVFGNAHKKLETHWRDRGGLRGYSNHIQEAAKNFEHITVHSDVWVIDTPVSSLSCHLFLNAIQLLEIKGILPPSEKIVEKANWAFREAFFAQLADISDRKVQFEIAQRLGLPLAAIQEQIDSGEAYAQLSQDFDLVKEHSVTVSPTLIFNEGRQKLNGNVGYRVIEANIRELLNNPRDEQSWC